MGRQLLERCPPGWVKCNCGQWTKWKFWNGSRWVPRCFDCGKILGRARKKGGDEIEHDADIQ